MKNLLLILVVLFVSINLEAQWVSQASGVSAGLVSVSAIDSNICWIGGSNGTVLRTTDGGSTWTNVGGGLVIGTSNIVDNVNALDANNCLASTFSPTGSLTYAYKTTNGGSTWTQVFVQSPGGLDGIHMTSASDGFMVGDPVNSRWSIFKTKDGGSTWDSSGLKLMALNSEGGWNNSIFAEGSNIWFGTTDSRIFHSSDNGSSWSIQSTSMTDIHSIYFSGNFGYAAGSSTVPGATLSITTNFGATWTKSSFQSLAVCTGVAAKGSRVIFCTLTGVIFLSTDNGLSFSRQDLLANATFYHIDIAKTGNTAWACGLDGLIRKGSINPVTGVNDNLTVPITFNLSQNYPNPFNPATSISYSISKSGVVKLIVYNTLGQKVKELVNEVKDAGNYNISFNASELASGTYFYKIETAEFSQVKKMILLK